MVSWKDSFDRVNTELELNKRKKQALEDLHLAGRISQFAYECLNKELREEIEQIEVKRKALTEKMTRKLNELEEQRIALEIFLANTEMAYAAGEIDEDLHGKESVALGLGLESCKQELNWIKEIIIQLVPKEADFQTTSQGTSVEPEASEPASEAIVEKAADAASNVTVEMPIEATVATAEVKTEQIQPPVETQQSPPVTSDEGGQSPTN